MSGGFIPDEDLPQGGRRRKTLRANRIGELKEGSLKKLGYSATKGKTIRHKAIRKAVKRYGPVSTFRKLNAVAILTKRSAKGKSRTYKNDRNWTKKMFMRK
jgi:Family of unknown function (DUF5771)